MELEDFLDELNEKKNFKPLIIGFGELGTTIINKINMIEDYCFEAYLCDENNYNSILFNDNVMVVFVGNINNQKNLELLIKTINKKSNVFNIAFLNGCMIDKNIYDILDENEIFNFDTRNVEQIIQIIKYFYDTYKNPGIIGVDFYDFKYLFKGKKNIYYYSLEGEDSINVISKLMEISKDKLDSIDRAGILFEFSHEKYGLSKLYQTINKFRESYKNIDIICATNLNEDKDNIIKINLFI